MASKSRLVEIKNPFVTEEEDEELDESNRFTIASAAATIKYLRSNGMDKLLADFEAGLSTSEKAQIRKFERTGEEE